MFSGLLLAGLGCAPREGDVQLPAPRVLAENAAWTWFNDERAIFVGPRLYVGYVDTAGYSTVSVHAVGSDVPTQAYRLSSFKQADDHNNPALLQLGGRVLATYAQHHVEPFWYWRFAGGASDSVGWSPERRTSRLDAPTTYNNLFRLAEEERIYNFFRGTNFDPVYMTSKDGGQHWSAPQHLIRSGNGGTRPYVKYVSNGADRIDLVYTQAHPRQEKNNVYHVFYQNGYLHRSDGTRIQRLPGDGVEPMPVEAGTLVYDADEAGRGWVWDIEYAVAGAPVAVYIAARDSTTGNDLRYRYARWDAEAAAWHEQEIAYAGTHLYDGENHYAGGIAIDPTDPRTVYISSDVHPVTGDTTAHYQIYRGTTVDGGAAWTWMPFTQSDSLDNIRPFVARGDGSHRAVLWLRGRYTTYQNYATDVVGVVE